MARPGSIAVVLHDLALGGTERIALRLAGAWARAGIEVTILCGDPRGPLRPLVPGGARLVAIEPAILRGRGSRRRLGAAAARHLAASPVDGLFVIGNFHWDAVPAIAALPRPVRPSIVAQVSSPLAMPQRGRFGQWLFERRMRRTLAGADVVVAMDADGAARADRILGRTIAHAIPLPAINDDTAPPRPAPPAPLVVAAGRLIHQKGFDLLIDAIARVPEARLVIVGDGPARAALARRIARRGLGDRATLAGFVPDIRPWLDAARLFVLPSRFEGYGAVIVEALAAGRPVIATRTTPAVDDLLTVTERGAIVPPGNVAALAAAIRRQLAAPPPDPAMLATAIAPYRLSAGAAAYLDLFAAIAR